MQGARSLRFRNKKRPVSYPETGFGMRYPRNCSMTLSKLIGAFVRKHWLSYASAGAMLAAIAVLTVWIPRKVGAVVDALVAHRLAGNELFSQLAWLAAMGLAIYFMRVGWRLQLFAAAYQFGVELRTRLYCRLSLQGPDFYQRQRTGDLMALATNDVDAIEMAAGEAMLAAFDGSLTLVMVLAMMFLGVDWRLTLVALLPFPFMAYAFWRISGHVHDASTDALNRFSDLNDHVQETLSGVRTLRALGLEQRSAQQFAQLAENAAKANVAATCVGQDARRGRPDRRRQVDAAAADTAAVRTACRRTVLGLASAGGIPARCPAQGACLGATRVFPVLRLDRGKHCAGAA